MAATARIPDPLTSTPFRGSAAITAGLISERMLRSRPWQRLLPDVYAHRDLPLDHRAWCTAVSLIIPPGTAIGGASAAHLWGAAMLHDDQPVAVVAPRDKWVNRHPRIKAHHTILDETDVTTVDGLPVTTPGRTAFDVGRRLGRAEALILLDGMLHASHLDISDAIELARERRRWPATARLRALLALADGRAESPMETRLRLLLHDAGVPAAVPQLEVRDTRGILIGRVDLGWPELKVAVEYEGDHHRERVRFRRDVARLNALRDSGWVVRRFTADDVLRSPRRMVRAVSTELGRAARLR